MKMPGKVRLLLQSRQLALWSHHLPASYSPERADGSFTHVTLRLDPH